MWREDEAEQHEDQARHHGECHGRDNTDQSPDRAAQRGTRPHGLIAA
jgi:hypothetical protein